MFNNKKRWQVALAIPEHGAITRRSQFKVKSTIKEERQAKKGSGKGSKTKDKEVKKRGKGKAKKSKGKGKKSKKAKSSKLNRVKKMAKSIKSASQKLVSTEDSQAQPTEIAEATAEKGKDCKRIRKSNQQTTPQQPSNSKQVDKPKPKAKAKSQPGPRAKAESQPGPISKGTNPKRKRPTTSNETGDAIGDEIRGIIELFDPDDSQKASLECIRVLTSILETCQAECGGGTCHGHCHKFNLPLSDAFQLSIYWCRRAVGVKILKDDSEKKFCQIAYFGSGPCTYANWVLARIWVTQFKFGNLLYSNTPKLCWLSILYILFPILIYIYIYIYIFPI